MFLRLKTISLCDRTRLRFLKIGCDVNCLPKFLSIDAAVAKRQYEKKNLQWNNDIEQRAFSLQLCVNYGNKDKKCTIFFYLWQINIVLSSQRCELIDKYNVNSLFDSTKCAIHMEFWIVPSLCVFFFSLKKMIKLNLLTFKTINNNIVLDRKKNETSDGIHDKTSDALFQNELFLQSTKFSGLVWLNRGLILVDEIFDQKHLMKFSSENQPKKFKKIVKFCCEHNVLAARKETYKVQNPPKKTYKV